MKQNRTYLAPLTWPSSIWPAQPTSSPLSSSSSARRTNRGEAWGAPERPRPPPASPWPPPASSRRPGPRPRRHAPPQASHSLPELLSSSGSLARSHRTHPPPTTSSLVATGPPSLPRLAQRLRLDLLFLSTKPCIAAHVAVPLLGHRRSSPFDSPPTGRPRAR